MFRLSRLLLLAVYVALWIDLALMVVLTWPLGLFFLCYVASRGKKKRPHLTTLGSARWAGKFELKLAGLLGGERGLAVGRLAVDGEEG